MRIDRRDLICRSTGGAIALGLVDQARAQPTPAAKPPRRIGQSQGGAIVMLAELTVKPERLDEFLAYTTANLAVSRAYPGNLAFDILINEAEPERVVFYEVWESPSSQQKYMAWRAQAGDVTKLLGFLATQPRFTQLRPLPA